MEAADQLRKPDVARSLGRALLHSLFPITALLIITGTLVWGPWVTLILGYGWWKVVGRTA